MLYVVPYKIRFSQHSRRYLSVYIHVVGLCLNVITFFFSPPYYCMYCKQQLGLSDISAFPTLEKKTFAIYCGSISTGIPWYITYVRTSVRQLTFGSECTCMNR